MPVPWISRRLGGGQLDYADESEYVRETFRQALAGHDLQPEMATAYEQEEESLPPKPGTRSELQEGEDRFR